MRRKAEALRETLDEFVTQLEYPMLVVGCIEDELAYLFKFMEGLDETHPESFVLIFAGAFTTRHAYLDSMVEFLRVQLAGAEPVRAERGEPPFPPLPPELADARLAPEHRLQHLLTYLGKLVPNDQEHSVVVGLLPLSCSDVQAYVQLVGSVMPIPEPQPWMAPLRIIARDDRTQPLLKPAMERYKVEHVLYFEIDFSTPAVTNALAVDAADPTLPMAERMACLHQLAAVDFAYRRYPDAVQKYSVLNDYYEAQKLPAMQAICINGAADALRSGGQPELAKQMLQSGLAIAMKAKSLPALVNLFISITDVCTELGHHEDAESYADSGAKVANAAISPTVYADMFEKKGAAQLAQNKIAEGLASYKKCEELCKLYEYFYRWKSVLNRQVEFYRQAGMASQLHDAEHELALVEELERRGGKAGVQEQLKHQHDHAHGSAS
jgi:tetratricopeptide (TPR) repeat protein